jgi:hypothetical protein
MGGLISLATIVFYGGTLVSQVNSLDRRVTTIENAGPATLQSHIALDEQRYIDHERRIEITEKLLPSMDRKLDQLLKKP